MDDTSQYDQQLAIYRTTLRHLRDQAAKFGGEAMAPVPIMHQLRDTRADIARVKATLRAAGVVVIDAPEDFPASQPDVLSAQALLDAMPLNAVPDPAPFPSFSRMPYAPNPHFVGRDDALLALAQALNGGGRVALGPRAAATGLGGIGKTSVAAEFVHRYGQYFAGGVFWLSFADPAAVAGEVASCGGPGLLNLHPAFGDLKLDEQVALVTAAWRQETPRLLVFDNCEDPKLVETWAPPTGGCRVLITSRRQRWPSGLRVQTQQLAVLARTNSIALLQQLASRLTAAEANAIATELGDLPLALQLAGSYLAQFGLTRVSTYLAELKSADIINHPSLEGWHDEDISLTAHDRHVGRTVLVSHQYLKPNDPIDALAHQLLARAACLAPAEPIPLDLLLATADLDSESTEGQRALHRLLNLSLLTSEADDTVQVHRLVHAVVQAIVQDATALAAVEAGLIELALALNAAGYPSAMQPLVGHLRWLTRPTAMREDMMMSHLCATLGDYLESTGDYSGSQPLYEWALAIQEQTLGPEHPETASSLNNLAYLFHIMGNYGGAQPHLVRVLAIREQVLGPDHPSTANSLNNLASLLHDMGDYAAARPLYERALMIQVRVLGPDHPSTASSLNNLALLLQDMGDYAEARPLYEQALAVTEQALGTNHPETATSLHNLAYLLDAMGDYAEARPLYERALMISEQALGPDHPATASSLNNLAGLLQDIGDHVGARSRFERALAIREQVLGPDHPDTARSLNSLARLLRAMGDYTGALLLVERALAIREHALGPHHPETASSLHNLAALLHVTGDYTRARLLYERALAITEQALGPDHPNIATSLNKLGGLLQITGDYAGARLLLEKALAIYEQALGQDHPSTAKVRRNLAGLDAAVQESPGEDQEHPAEAGDPDHDDAPPQA